MSSLYEITADLTRLMDMLDDPEIEVDEQAILDSWEGLEGEMNDKVESWLKVIRIKDADIKARKEEIKRMEAVSARDQKAIDNMKSALMYLMDMANVKKAGTPILSCSIANNGGVEPLVWAEGYKEDPSLLPEQWRTETKVYKANTDEIRAALKEGETIPGVELGARGRHLTIK